VTLGSSPPGKTEESAAVTSDYGTWSTNNRGRGELRGGDVDSALSNSLSNISIGDCAESRDYSVRLEWANTSSFLIIPNRSRYNLRNNFSVVLEESAATGGFLPSLSLIQVSPLIHVSKYSLILPALFCTQCCPPTSRVHVFRKLINKFTHFRTVKVRKGWMVFPIDTEGTYVICKSVLDPVVRHCDVSREVETDFVLLDYPLVRVKFPRLSVDEGVRVKGQVFFDELLGGGGEEQQALLASPIVSLAPHGDPVFNRDVQVTIEVVVGGHQVESSGSNLRLYVDRKNLYESCWSPIEDFKVVRKNGGSRTFVVFSVRHFSLFKIVWEGVRKTSRG
jgi:hypothetical protein